MGIFSRKIKPEPLKAFDRVNIGVYGLDAEGVMLARALSRADRAFNVIGADPDPRITDFAMRDPCVFLGGADARILRGCTAVFLMGGNLPEKIAETFNVLGRTAVIAAVNADFAALVKALPRGIRFCGVTMEPDESAAAAAADAGKPSRRERQRIEEAGKIGYPYDASAAAAESGRFRVQKALITSGADAELLRGILAKISSDTETEEL